MDLIKKILFKCKDITYSNFSISDRKYILTTSKVFTIIDEYYYDKGLSTNFNISHLKRLQHLQELIKF